MMVGRRAALVLVDGAEVELTPTEYRLLVTLMERRGRVQSRQQLLETAWDIHARIETRTVDMHVQRLRTKLGASGDLVETATLGTCEVTGISSVDSLTVKAYDGSRHELTGIGWASRARLVETSRNDAGESEEADDARVAPAPRG